MMGITVLSGVVTVVGDILAVRPFGMVGVASVVAAAIVLQQMLMLAFVRIRCGIWTHASPLLLAESLRTLNESRARQRHGS
jgi:hypothetical protein